MKFWTIVKTVVIGIIAVIVAFLAYKRNQRKLLSGLINNNKIKETLVKNRIKDLEKDKTANKKEIGKLKKDLKVINTELREMEHIYNVGDEEEAAEFLKNFLNS